MKDPYYVRLVKLSEFERLNYELQVRLCQYLEIQWQFCFSLNKEISFILYILYSNISKENSQQCIF